MTIFVLTTIALALFVAWLAWEVRHAVREDEDTEKR